MMTLAVQVMLPRWMPDHVLTILAFAAVLVVLQFTASQSAEARRVVRRVAVAVTLSVLAALGVTYAADLPIGNVCKDIEPGTFLWYFMGCFLG
jgi:hypothetical protein